MPMMGAPMGQIGQMPYMGAPTGGAPMAQQPMGQQPMGMCYMGGQMAGLLHLWLLHFELCTWCFDFTYRVQQSHSNLMHIHPFI